MERVISPALCLACFMLLFLWANMAVDLQAMLIILSSLCPKILTSAPQLLSVETHELDNQDPLSHSAFCVKANCSLLASEPTRRHAHTAQGKVLG